MFKAICWIIHTIGVLRMMSRVFSVGATMVTETCFATFLLFCRSKAGKMDKGMLFITLSKNFSSIRQVTYWIFHINR